LKTTKYKKLSITSFSIILLKLGIFLPIEYHYVTN
jgi:hypothetical protein